MGLFGKKNKDNEDIEAASPEQDLDALVMSAIEQADEEEEQRKADRKQAEIDRIAKMNEERERAEEARKAAAERLKNIPNEGRRFFLIVETSNAVASGVEVTGNLHGEMKKGDQVFVYRPDGKSIEGKAGTIASAEDGKTAEGAKNARVTVCIEIDGNAVSADPAGSQPRFSVMSGVKANQDGKAGPVENPYLLGLSLGYKDLHSDKDYMKILMNLIVRARFILPVHDMGSDDAGKKKLRLITINDKMDPNKRNMAVFTDFAALSAWKNVFDDEHRPSVTVMSFNAVVKQIRNDDMGIAVNPFGPVGIQLPPRMIAQVTSSESYKRNIKN